MKTTRLLAVLATFLVLVSAVSAQAAFPGLRAILSPDVARRAGLDQLTPDQIAILDAAISGYVSQVAANQSQTVSTAVAQQQTRSFWSRFGLPEFKREASWEQRPIMTAKVVKWVGPNSFLLDNGQIWQGTDPIPYELVGLEIEIQPRPLGDYALEMKDKHIVVRVTRVQ